MKITATLFAASAALLFSAETLAQTFTGKPTYKIEAKRAGVHIGDIHIELFPLIAPLHVANFDNLVDDQFYDSTAFHRVIPGFMIQGGDPRSKNDALVNTWGQGYTWQPTVNAEFSAVSHQRGILSAARASSINSATSQFFICVAPSTHLDNEYSAYGKVTSGMAVVDNIVNSPRNAQDRPLQKVEMFITRTGSNDLVPVAPTLLSPADNFAGAQANQLLVFSAVQDAAMYQIQVSADPTFNSLLLEEDLSQTATFFELNSLQPQTQYHWRMRTNNGGHLSAWSASRSFSTGLAAPVLVAPAHASTIASTTANLEWQALTGATSYRLQVSTTPNFTSSVIIDSSGITSPNITLNNLTPGENYFWRIAAQQNGADGFFSTHWRFKVGVVGVADDLAGNYVELNPNPAQNSATVRYSVQTAGTIQAALYDLNGKLVKELLNTEHAPGDYSETIDLNGVAAGVYVLQVSGDDFTMNKKLVVAK